MRQTNTHLALLAFTGIAFVWSGIQPFNRLTWVLEIFPILLAAPVIFWFWRRPLPGQLRFTTLVYALIAVHAVILMIGGHYSYAEVPWFNWLKDRYQMDRNYYDRVGHFAQGFVPAMVAREVLLRKSRMARGVMLSFLTVAIPMAVSAWYEILEFISARTLGNSSESFLGTQGDVWDTQWDMTMCFIGALVALALLPRWHDRQIRALEPASEV